MRRLACVCLGVALFSSVLHAGQIYGSVTSGGRSVAKAVIEINCGGVTTTGATASDGSYRINVAQRGQCKLVLPGYTGRPSADVFSYPNPSQYDFELVRTGGSYRLRRR